MRARLKSLGLDNYLYVNNEYSWPDETIDASYIERGIIGLFVIDILRLAQTKAALLKNFRMQPSEVDKMVYWEFEYMIEALNQQVKDENERQQAEMEKYKVNENLSKASKPPKYSAPKTPQMPSFGTMKTPSFKF